MALMAIIEVHYGARQSTYPRTSGDSWADRESAHRNVYEDTDTGTRICFINDRPAAAKLGNRHYVTDFSIPSIRIARTIAAWLRDEGVDIPRGPSGQILTHLFRNRLIAASRLKQAALQMAPPEMCRLLTEVAPGDDAFRLYKCDVTSDDASFEYWQPIDVMSGERDRDDSRARGNLYRESISLVQSMQQQYDWVNWGEMFDDYGTEVEEEARVNSADPNLTPTGKAWMLWDLMNHYGADEFDYDPLRITQGELDWRWWE